MGVYDRGYMRTDYPGRKTVGGLPLFSVNTWIILFCCLVFVADQLSGRMIGIYQVQFADGEYTVMRPLEFFGHFSVGLALWQHQYWRFITFQFLHANLTHIAFNMFTLYMFGPMIEAYLGRVRYLAFYLLCGASGAVFYTLLWKLNILHTLPYVPLVGASAGIFGVLVGAARVAPMIRVLVFGIIPMPLRTLAWWLIGVAVITIFTAGNNAGGEAGHLGGAALGFILMQFPQLLSVFDLPAFSRRQISR